MTKVSVHITVKVKSIENKIDAHAPVNGKAVAVPHDWNETFQCSRWNFEQYYRHDDLGKFLNEWLCNQRWCTFGF
ncbi:MAG: hypothetical protein U0T78_09025 [Cloacibacterium normanense]